MARSGLGLALVAAALVLALASEAPRPTLPAPRPRPVPVAPAPRVPVPAASPARPSPVAPTPAPSPAPSPDLVELVVLHTNDIHGQALPFGRGDKARGGLAALAFAIGREREDARKHGWDSVLVDAGDTWVGPPEGTRTEGAFVIDVLNGLHFLVGAIGNHEFDHGPEVAARNARRSSYPILAANVRDSARNARPEWLASDVHARVAGLDLRFVGVVTSRIREVTTAKATVGLDFEAEADAIDRELARGSADLTILVTHSGDQVDRKLAERFHGRIAAIVGGHSHREIDPAWHVPESAKDAVLVGQTGAKTRNLGVMHFVYDRGRHALASSEGHLVPVIPAEGEDPEVKRLVAAEVAEVDKLLGVKLCDLDAPIEVLRGARSSPLGNLVCDVLREGAGVDAAFTNKAGLRANLAAGPVLLRHLHEVDPFGNTVVTMSFTGAQLRTLLDSMCDSPTGVLEVSGLVVRFDESAPRGQRVESVLVGGKPLEEGHTYRVATNNFLAGGGDGHKTFLAGSDVRDEGIPVRDLLRKKLEGAGHYDPGALDERLVSTRKR